MSRNNKPLLSFEQAKSITKEAQKKTIYFTGYYSKHGTSKSLQWWHGEKEHIAYGFIGSVSNVTFTETERTAETNFTEAAALEISRLGHTAEVEHELSRSLRKRTSAFANLF